MYMYSYVATDSLEKKIDLSRRNKLQLLTTDTGPLIWAGSETSHQILLFRIRYPGLSGYISQRGLPENPLTPVLGI